MSMQTTGGSTGEQHVYVGIDSHKKSWKVCFIVGEAVHKPFSQDPDPATLLTTLQRRFPAATYHLAYEAGFAGNWIARWYRDRAIDCIVVSAADIPTTNKDRRQKTDTRDCRKIAESLVNNSLTPLYVPSEQAEDDRQFVRARSALVKNQTRLKNQIKSLLAVAGTQLPPTGEMTHWTKQFIKWLQGLFEDRPMRRQELLVYLEELLWVRRQILLLTQEIRALARSERFAVEVDLLVSTPGISTTGAMMLMSELVDIRRFAGFDHLASYIGLVPSTHSSGQSERTRGITPRHSSHVRGLLIESAWVAIRCDDELREAFERICQRMPKNRAIILIARKLLRRIHHVLLHKEPYRINNALETQTLETQTLETQTLETHDADDCSENSSEAHD
jgi:transposase